MLIPHSKRGAARRALACALVAIGACIPASVSAHFILTEPAASLSQDALGSPQKLGPCGDDGTGTPTGMVTAFQAGQTITITIDEKIYHPGHYRISLGMKGPGDLPAEPVVTPDANSPCGSAPIEAKPTFPVLADGVFEHQAPFNGPQSVTITLPSDVTCTNCTLQVLEFMSNHALNNPGGCYYHHCADISIQGGTGPDGGPGSSGSGSGSSSTAGAGGSDATGGGGSDGGYQPADGSCGCRLTGGDPSIPAAMGLASIAALAVLTLRRRRRASLR